jgi:ABC-type sugar transport system permease subunit
MLDSLSSKAMSRLRRMLGTSRPWHFLSIPLAVYAIMTLYPLVYSMFLSFTQWSGMGGSPEFVGLANYRYLLSRGSLALALENNLIWMLFFVPIPTGIGFLLAYALRENTKLNIFFRSVFYLPMVLSFAVMAIMWTWVYEPTRGLLQALLTATHLPTPSESFLTNPDTALIAMSIVGIWHWVGFSMILYLAAIQDIPRNVLEAARLDGITWFRNITSIILPLVRHATIIVVSIGLILSVKVFDLIYIMSGGYYKNDVLATLVWRYAFDRHRVGRAAAVAVVQFAIIAAVVVPYVLYQKRRGEIEL